MNLSKIALLTSLLIALLSIALYYYQVGESTDQKIYLAIVVAAIVGYTFAWGMLFVTKRSVAAINIRLTGEEKILRQGVARSLKTAMGVTGKLMLTDRNLIFMPLKITDRDPQLSWTRAEIKDVKQRKSWDTFRNGIIIELFDKQSHTFAIDDARDWVTLIKHEMAIPNDIS
jgi:hypothetical protein